MPETNRTQPSTVQRRDGFPDDSRTVRAHAGEAIEDGYNVPGLLLCAIGIVALAGALTAAGYGFPTRALTAGVICAVSVVGGIAWLLLEHRRVKAKEGLALHEQRGH